MQRQILIDPRGRRWMVEVPATRRDRMRGLRDRRWLAPDHALALPRCRSVHTFGMRFRIAVVFLDGGWRVLEVRRTPPGRLLLPRPRARHVLECPIDTDLRPGDRLRWVDALIPGRSASRGSRVIAREAGSADPASSGAKLSGSR